MVRVKKRKEEKENVKEIGVGETKKVTKRSERGAAS